MKRGYDNESGLIYLEENGELIGCEYPDCSFIECKSFSLEENRCTTIKGENCIWEEPNKK